MARHWTSSTDVSTSSAGAIRVKRVFRTKTSNKLVTKNGRMMVWFDVMTSDTKLASNGGLFSPVAQSDLSPCWSCSGWLLSSHICGNTFCEPWFDTPVIKVDVFASVSAKNEIFDTSTSVFENVKQNGVTQVGTKELLFVFFLLLRKKVFNWVTKIIDSLFLEKLKIKFLKLFFSFLVAPELLNHWSVVFDWTAKNFEFLSHRERCRKFLGTFSSISRTFWKLDSKVKIT